MKDNYLEVYVRESDESIPRERWSILAIFQASFATGGLVRDTASEY